MNISNKKFNREFTSLDKYEVGISLTGSEVKSIRLGRARLEGAYVKFDSMGRLMLVGCDISLYSFAHDKLQYDPKRTRYLLMHKKELVKLHSKLSRGGANNTIIPTKFYFKGNIIKLEISLASGKKTWEVGKMEKNEDTKRNVAKEMKDYLKK